MPTIKGFLSKPFNSLHLEEFDFSSENDEQIQLLADAINTNQNLKYVYFSGIKLQDFNFAKTKSLFTAMKHNKNINGLYFKQCGIQDLNAAQADALLEAIKTTEIINLILENDSIVQPGPALDFITRLANTPVTNLTLESIDMEHLDFDSRFSCIQALSRGHLVSLFLSEVSLCSGLKNASTHPLSTLLRTLFESGIQHLSLRANILGYNTSADNWETILNYKEWESIFTLINNTHTLKSLDLAFCRLNDVVELDESKDFIGLLASFLKTTSLASIDISGNEFSHDASLRLIKAALLNPNLTLVFNAGNRPVKEFKEAFEMLAIEAQPPQKNVSAVLPSRTLILSNSLDEANRTSGSTQQPTAGDKLRNGSISPTRTQ